LWKPDKSSDLGKRMFPSGAGALLGTPVMGDDIWRNFQCLVLLPRIEKVYPSRQHITPQKGSSVVSLPRCSERNVPEPQHVVHVCLHKKRIYPLVTSEIICWVGSFIFIWLRSGGQQAIQRKNKTVKTSVGGVLDCPTCGKVSSSSCVAGKLMLLIFRVTVFVR
jgi:hypothetical protein